MHAAYIAGIIDGEGTMGLYPRNGRDSLPSPILAVSGSHRPLLDALRDHYGFGSVFEYAPGAFQPEVRRTKQMIRWQVSAWDQIAEVLTEVLPYLIEKREQAEIMLTVHGIRPGRGGVAVGAQRAGIFVAAESLRTLKKG